MQTLNKISYVLLTAVAFLPILLSTNASAQGRVPWSFPDLDKKIAVVLPNEDEQRFMQIPWRLNLMEARAESARTGKPMFVWQMNGHPLGHT